MMRRHTTRAIFVGLALGLAAAAASTAVADASVTAAASDLGRCLSEGQSPTGHGCYGMSVVPSTSATATVRIAWDLQLTDTVDSTWQGGVWMQRWPIAGQWSSYPKAGSLPPGTAQSDCDVPFATSAGCYASFAGPTGTLDLTFPPSMAGYVYEVVTMDSACSPDGATCGPSGGSVNATGNDKYVYVVKASRYKDRKSAWKVARTCPAARLRTSACQPAALAILAKTIGGGSPVALP
jgi:hypothetical protein